MTTPGLSSTGFVPATQAEILADLEASQRAEISPTIDLSPSSPQGQWNAIGSRQVAMLWEALAALWAAMDPDDATGAALDRICAITGTTREAATKSRATCTVNVNPGTYAIGTLVAHIAGKPSARFSNSVAVVNSGGSAANVTGILFEALETGPLSGASGTLTVIAGPVSGWNSVTNTADIVPGKLRETDGELRLRRNQEVANPGSASEGGIAADILRNVSNVESVTVIANETDATVDSIPPHAIECIVFGPESPSAADDDAVAAQILASKAAGPGTYGTTTRTILDSQGQSKAVKFTRPTALTPTVAITAIVDSATYAGDVELKSKLSTRASEVLKPGRDLSWSLVAGWAHEVPGVLRVTNITLAGVSMTDYAVGTRQYARIQTANVTVTATPGTP